VAQSVSSGLQSAAVASVSTVAAKLLVDWDGDGNLTDETAYLVEMSGEMAVVDEQGPSPLGSTVASSLSFTLDNTSGRFSPFKAGSAPGTSAGYGCRVAAEIGYTFTSGGATVTETVRMFTGTLEAPEESGYPARVAFRALGYEALAKEQRKSTPLHIGERSDAYLIALGALLTGDLGWANGHPKTGARIIPYAWLDDESIREECLRVASAEAGRFYWDKEGKRRFEPWSYLLTAPHSTSSQFTFTTAHFQNIQPAVDYTSVIDQVVVKWRPRVQGGLIVVYEHQEPIELDPGGSTTIWATFDGPVPAGQLVNPIAGTDYTARTAGYADKTQDVTVTLGSVDGTDRFAQRVAVTLENTDSNSVVFVDGLTIRGYGVVASAEQTYDTGEPEGVVAPRVLTIDNVYIQTAAAAEAVGEALKARLGAPRRVVTLERVPAIPWLEVADRVTVADSQTGVSGDFYITGFTWEYPKMTMSFTLLDVTNLFPHTDYFVVGTTALGDGRCWY